MNRRVSQPDIVNPPSQHADVTAVDQVTAHPRIDPLDLVRFAAQECPDLIVVVDPTGVVRWVNEAVERIFGVALTYPIDHAIWDFIHPDDLVTAAGAVSEASRTTGYHQPTVFRVGIDDSGWIECEVNGSTIEAADGPWMVLAVRATGDQDEVTGRRRRIEQLIRTSSLECSSVPWTEVDSLVERYLQELAAVVGAELVELAWQEPDRPLQIGARWPVVRTGPATRRTATSFEPLWPLEETALDLLRFTRDIPSLGQSSARDRLVALGSDAAVEVPLSPGAPWSVLRCAFGERWQRWDDANVDLVVVLASTLIATLRRCLAEEHLHEQARTDALTGLINRAELYRGFGELLARHERAWQRSSEAPGTPGAEPLGLGVLYCDLDHFKDVNDRYGHAAGDQLLVDVADALRANTREGDLIARVGGDEFILVCPDLESPETLSLVIARLTHAVEALAPVGIPLRLSVGTALARPGLGEDELVRLADEGMYRAKRQRRRRNDGLGRAVESLRS